MQSPRASSRPSHLSHTPLFSITRYSRRTLGIAAALALSAVLLSACGGGSGYSASSSPARSAVTPTLPSGAVQGASSSGSQQVDVTEKDFGIGLHKQSANAGSITFHVSNQGPTTHEFVVFKTDAAADALPVDENKVDEEAQELTHIDEIEDIGAAESKDLTVALDPGNYVLICNLPAHYGLGMRAPLHVI
jgi:uncharacterized cupredoxin-like copper-binding protein